MNELADKNESTIKWNDKSSETKNKTKKAKDLLDQTEDLSITGQEKLSDVLANTLHINNINSNLTNGTKDHKENSSDSQHDQINESSRQTAYDVNIVQSDIASIKEQNLDVSQVRLEEIAHNLESSHQNHDQSAHDDIEIVSYESELQMPSIMRLIQKDLSEPYSIYTYRYFIHNWPKLCFLAMHEGNCIGAIVCKLDMHRNVVKRGYIAMLAVDEKYRKKGIGSKLVQKAIQVMISDNADEVVLETEITNKPALKLYENLGFVRDKRLFRYYLNGVDALRLKLWLR